MSTMTIAIRHYHGKHEVAHEPTVTVTETCQTLALQEQLGFPTPVSRCRCPIHRPDLHPETTA